MGWVVGWSMINVLKFISQMRDVVGMVANWFVMNSYRKRGTQIN